MQFESQLIQVHLKETFRTSKGEADEKTVCVVSLGDALGECCPSLHYGYSAEDCCDSISERVFSIDRESFDLAQVHDELRGVCGDRLSMLAGLDIALYDYASLKDSLPLWRYLKLPDPAGKESSYTISVDQPSGVEERLKSAADFRIIKLKLGCEYDQDNLELLGRLPGRTIRVDANGALDLDDIEWLVRAAYDLKLELIEEPLSDPTASNLRELQKELKCPIIMDESVKSVDDLRAFEECIGGVNIKLQKVGGIRNALEIIESARRADMKIMIGCMLETSIGISAAAHLAGAADYLDLDSATLIADDPFDGMTLKDGRLCFPDRSGHGAVRRN